MTEKTNENKIVSKYDKLIEKLTALKELEAANTTPSVAEYIAQHEFKKLVTKELAFNPKVYYKAKAHLKESEYCAVCQCYVKNIKPHKISEKHQKKAQTVST